MDMVFNSEYLLKIKEEYNRHVILSQLETYNNFIVETLEKYDHIIEKAINEFKYNPYTLEFIFSVPICYIYGPKEVLDKILSENKLIKHVNVYILNLDVIKNTFPDSRIQFLRLVESQNKAMFKLIYLPETKD